MGGGPVGVATGVAFAERGHPVALVDVDEQKLHQLARGDVPFYEPGLGAAYARMLKRGRIRALSDPAAGLARGAFAMICVGTPAREDGSIGIEFSAVVNSIRELMERMDWLHANFDSPVLIEEYIEGRELYVGIIGNDKPEALPIIELDLSKLPEGTPRIAAAEVKWGKGTRAYRDTKSAIAENLSDETVQLLHQTAMAAYQALELRDYGRVDMRLQPDGRVQVIEVNPNPWLSSRAEFAMAARKSGRTYARLVEEIVELARARA